MNITSHDLKLMNNAKPTAERVLSSFIGRYREPELQALALLHFAPTHSSEYEIMPPASRA